MPEEDIRKVSSAIDKLDKSPWEAVKKEILEKGQSEEIADKIWTFVQHSGSIREVIDILKQSGINNATAQQGIQEMEVLADYVEAFNIQDNLKFDLSLARGLDYYTGLIYEAVTAASAPPKNASELKKEAKEKMKMHQPMLVLDRLLQVAVTTTWLVCFQIINLSHVLVFPLVSRDYSPSSNKEQTCRNSTHNTLMSTLWLSVVAKDGMDS